MGFRIIILCLLVEVTPQFAFSASYYMRRDGTAANKAAAIGPTSDPAACMTPTVHNAQTFSAGDTIFLSSLGGDFTNGIVIPSSGSVGSVITYTKAVGNAPVIHVAGAAIPFNMASKNYITIDGIKVQSDAERGVNISGTVTGITVQNCDITSATYGITSSGISTSCVVSNCWGTNNLYNVYFFNAVNGPIAIYGSSFTNGRGIYVLNSTALTVSNYQHVGATINSIKAEKVGSATIVNATNKSSVAWAFNFLNCTNISVSNCYGFDSGGAFYSDGGNGHIFNDCYATNSSTGFWGINGAFNLRYTNCVAINGNSDGIGVTDYVWDVVWSKCKSFGNGNKSSTANGDGFTAHLTNHTVKATHCISVSNTCSGFAMVGLSQGIIEHCTIVGNAGDWVSEGGLKQIRGGIYFSLTAVSPTNGLSWTVTNCIVANNYPVEYWASSVSKSLVAMDYNVLWPKDPTALVTLDSLVTTNSWAVYHATYEPNSDSADPCLDTRYRPYAKTPTWNIGTELGPMTDYTGKMFQSRRTAGAYEYVTDNPRLLMFHR